MLLQELIQYILIQNGNGTHTFKSKRIRQVIDRIIVTNSGSSYSNRKVEISSQQYTPYRLKKIYLKLLLV